MFRLLAAENGFVHVCGHRGNSIASPENTLAALTSTRDAGGTSAEIDVMLTADGELVLMHDDFLDRTTDGSGLVSKPDPRRDPPPRRRARGSGRPSPASACRRSSKRWTTRGRSGSDWWSRSKEFQDPDGVVDRLADLIESSGSTSTRSSSPSITPSSSRRRTSSPASAPKASSTPVTPISPRWRGRPISTRSRSSTRCSGRRMATRCIGPV